MEGDDEVCAPFAKLGTGEGFESPVLLRLGLVGFAPGRFAKAANCAFACSANLGSAYPGFEFI